MKDYRIVDAKPWHIGPLLRRVDESELCRWFNRGLQPKHLLRVAIRDALYCRSVLLEERVVAMWGVTGSLMAPVGSVWFVLTPEARRFPVALVRGARQELNDLLATKRELRTVVDDDDHRAMRWLRFLGFDLTDADTTGLRHAILRGV